MDLSASPGRNKRSQEIQATYFPYFDWLRFVLACVVMLGHFGLFSIWLNAGSFAVEVFFALSGWLIGGILLDLERTDLPRFYFNRAVRIWAPYYLALAFLVTASLLRAPITPKWLEFVAYKATFVWNLFGTQQLAVFHDQMPLKGTGNHFWSVNAEEQFYLLAPVLLVLAARRLGRQPLTWAVLACAALASQLYGAIVLGVLAAIWHRRDPDFHLRPPVRLALALLLVCSALLLFNDRTYAYAAPLCALPIVLLLAVPGAKTRLGQWAGGLSYQLYLNHWIGIFVATAVLIPFGMRDSVVKPLLGVCISIGLAAVLYGWIDQPLLAKRGRFYTLDRGRRASWIARMASSPSASSSGCCSRRSRRRPTNPQSLFARSTAISICSCTRRAPRCASSGSRSACGATLRATSSSVGVGVGHQSMCERGQGADRTPLDVHRQLEGAVDDNVIAHAVDCRRRQAPALAEGRAERVVADAEGVLLKQQQLFVGLGFLEHRLVALGDVAEHHRLAAFLEHAGRVRSPRVDAESVADAAHQQAAHARPLPHRLELGRGRGKRRAAPFRTLPTRLHGCRGR